MSPAALLSPGWNLVLVFGQSKAQGDGRLIFQVTLELPKRQLFQLSLLGYTVPNLSCPHHNPYTKNNPKLQQNPYKSIPTQENLVEYGAFV